MTKALLALLVACSDPNPPELARVEVAVFPAVESRALDLLLLVDNSGSTDHWQDGLAADLPTLLADLADGAALPDLHIGIITPDMGTTGSLSPTPAPAVGTVGNGGCAGAGDAGLLRTRLVDVDDGNGGRTRNYDGPLAAALAKAVRIGSAGCGFEQHLHAIRRSLASDLWRPTASTAVIALVDEDDCSVLDPGFFDPDAAALGNLDSFRCAQFGLVCDQPLGEAGAKTSCRPDPASPWIEDPALAKDALDRLRGPARATFSALGGPAGPIAVEPRQQGGVSQLALAHACSEPSFAGPSPRLADLAGTFASRGQLHSICETSYAPALAAIARRIERSLGVACLDDALAVELTACVAHDVDAATRTELPRCPAATDCFDIAPDTARCGGGPRVVVDRKTPPAATAHVEVSCAPR